MSEVYILKSNQYITKALSQNVPYITPVTAEFKSTYLCGKLITELPNFVRHIHISCRLQE